MANDYYKINSKNTYNDLNSNKIEIKEEKKILKMNI